uniref:Uncharacterized protein n=1 Tax=Psilocybe cubensis TaxID=181762 RepID=A0A8H8CNA3_PSICU
MANLPPRPETPPKLREERRHPDERDRDRRPAQPMSRINRSVPERDRSYVPSRRPDTYIPGQDSRRESDRRDLSRERDRDRFRDIDRDRDRDRDRRRDRDFDRSPRKWELSDRERRAYDRDRGSYRRPASPIRRPGPSRRDSRSPPRRRPPLRSPSPYRSRPRSRSRTRTRSPRRSPMPSRRVRLGNHSINTSPRSCSPRKRSRSRDRSMSIDKGPPTLALPRSSSQPPRDTSRPAKEEHVDVKPSEEVPTVKLEEQPILISPRDVPESSLSEEAKPSIHETPQAEQNSPLPDTSTQLHLKAEEIKPERQESIISFSPAGSKGTLKTETSEDVSNKMDIVNSPNQTSTNSKRSPSPQPHQRATITNPQRNRSGRSPPRGPRNFPRGLPTQPTYAIGRRDSRRSYPVPGQPSYGKSEPEIKLPTIPKYERPKPSPELIALEAELAKLRTLRVTYAHQDSTQVKGLQRALHELDMASIDLSAAEGRRRVADAQLERAKTGTLGIDAPDLIDV